MTALIQLPDTGHLDSASLKNYSNMSFMSFMKLINSHSQLLQFIPPAVQSTATILLIELHALVLPCSLFNCPAPLPCFLHFIQQKFMKAFTAAFLLFSYVSLEYLIYIPREVLSMLLCLEKQILEHHDLIVSISWCLIAFCQTPRCSL